MYKIFLKLFSWEHDASITNKEKILFPKKCFIEIYQVQLFTHQKKLFLRTRLLPAAFTTLCSCPPKIELSSDGTKL